MSTTIEPIIKQIKNINHIPSSSWIDGIKLYAQQYSKRVTHLSQQGYGKKKVKSRKTRTRQNTKKNKYR